MKENAGCAEKESGVREKCGLRGKRDGVGEYADGAGKETA